MEEQDACILVVEGNPANMMLVSAVLSRAGYRTAQASSADEARRQLSLAAPDLVLMDIQLPGEDGLSLASELKSSPRHQWDPDHRPHCPRHERRRVARSCGWLRRVPCQAN